MTSVAVLDGVPAGAKSLVLIVDDPDAPDPKAPKMTWVHWVLYNLPPTTMSLAEDLSSEDLPKGTLSKASGHRKRTGSRRPAPSAGRPASLFPQTLCAGYGVARSWSAHQGET